MSSDDEVHHKKKKKDTSSNNYSIKPEKTTTKLDTSSWPLLLKVINYRYLPQIRTMMHLMLDHHILLLFLVDTHQQIDQLKIILSMESLTLINPPIPLLTKLLHG